MGTRDPRVDAYIENSAEFAQPILTHLRETIHAACPDVEEALKWGHPHFLYHGMLCGMASFKQHCGFGFWKAKLILEGAEGEEAMGQFGRITRVKDLPAKRVISGYVKKAMQLNIDGVKVEKKPKSAKAVKAALTVPADLAAALEIRKHRAALDTFDALSPSHRRDYIEWLTEAKRPETRKKRLEQALGMLAEGKTRNWKYERK